MPAASFSKKGRRRPSASVRSESGLSSMSFQTAADNNGHDIPKEEFEDDDLYNDEDGEYENDPDYVGIGDSQPHQDTANDTTMPARPTSAGTPGLTMSSSDDEDDDDDEVGEKSGETLNNAPATQKDVIVLAPVVTSSTPVSTRRTQAVASVPLSPVGNASKKVSKMNTTRSSIDAGSDYNTSRRSYLDPVLDGRRDPRYRSQSDRGTSSGPVSRGNRGLLAASSTDLSHRAKSRSSRESLRSERRGPASLSDYSYGGRNSQLLRPDYRRNDDNASISSRRSRTTSMASRMLDPESQVFPGTRIRRYIEPSLTDAMRRVMKQFSASGTAHLDDHRCIGYPIAVFVGATAIDVGSIINPVISGAVALYFGPGHPKNMAALLPAEDRTPAHIPNPKAPNTTSLSRRAELRSAITALHTVYELYRGRACAHVCIDSAYVAKAWGTWIPTWEADGWPGQDEDDYADRERWEDDYHERSNRRFPHRGSRRDGHGSESGERTRSRRGYSDRDRDFSYDNDNYSIEEDAYRRNQQRRNRRRGDESLDYDDERSSYLSMSDRRRSRRSINRAPGRRLVDEDLLRELADIRYDFGQIELDRLGSAHVYLLDRSHNPADKMARAVARNEAQLEQQLGSDTNPIGLDIDDADLSDAEGHLPYDDDRMEDDEWADTRSRLSRNSRLTSTSNTRSQSALNSHHRSTGGNGNSRNSITSNATSRLLRNSASLPAGHLRGQQRRQLDTFAEEDEYNLSNESAGFAGTRSGSRLDIPATKGIDARSLNSDRSKRSRAERERDDYLARQEQVSDDGLDDDQDEYERSQIRSTSRLSKAGNRLIGMPTASSERGNVGVGRRSMDVDSRRTSLDSRRRTSLSHPDLRNRFASQPPSESVRGALASAATRKSRRSFQISDDRDDHSRTQSVRGSSTYANTRANAHSSSSRALRRDYDDQDSELRSVRGTPKSATRFGRADDNLAVAIEPLNARSNPVFSRKLATRSSPSLRRTPAPEDEDYDWRASSPRKSTQRHRQRPARKERDWHPTTSHDIDDEQDNSIPPLRKKKSFFARLFSRKSKS